MKRLLSTTIKNMLHVGWGTHRKLSLKNSWILFFTLICATVPLCLAGQTSQPAPATVAIVFDTSPNSHDTELRWAALSFYRNCTTGDRILLFVVRGKNTRLMFSCTKTMQESEFGEIASIVNDIDHDWFAHADLSAALSGPIYQQLRQRCSQEEPAIVAVISTANFSDEQAKDIGEFGRNIKENHNWAFVITGLVDKTPRRIFLSASSRELYWYNLNDAIYGTMVDKWLKDIKRELTDTSSRPASTPDLLSTTVKQQEPNYPTVSKPSGNKANTIIMTPNKVATARAQNPQPKTDVVIPAAQENPAAKVEKTEPNIVVAPLPALADTNSQKDRAPAGIAKDTQKRPSTNAAVSPAAEPNTSSSKSLYDDANTKTHTTVQTPAQAAADSNVSHHRQSGAQNKASGIRANLVSWKEFVLPLLTIIGTVLVAITLVIALRNWNKARIWKKTAKQRVDAFANKSGQALQILMAKVGQSSYRLGNLRHFKKVFVGTSANNGIRIEYKGVMDRHLKIYRRFTSLRIKNLSKKPVMVTGHQLPPAKT